jgi:hypothetical protein
LKTSHVPYLSLNKVHATSTPDTAWSINRYSPYSS